LFGGGDGGGSAGDGGGGVGGVGEGGADGTGAEVDVTGAEVVKEGDGKGLGTAIIPLNEVAGWSVRTKPADVDEISVVKGYGAFDSVVLVEDEVFLRSCEENIRNTS